MEGRFLTVTIKDNIKKFVTESLNSDYVPLERGSTLLYIIKPHLLLEPDGWELMEIEEGYSQLRIELPELRKEYDSRNDRVYYCNTLFRDHIDAKGLKKVRKFLYNTYKASFRTFMDGWIERQYAAESDSDKEVVEQVVEGVTSFLNQYHIPFTEKDVEALRQDWQRHKRKNENYRFSPILY